MEMFCVHDISKKTTHATYITDQVTENIKISQYFLNFCQQKGDIVHSKYRLNENILVLTLPNKDSGFLGSLNFEYSADPRHYDHKFRVVHKAVFRCVGAINHLTAWTDVVICPPNRKNGLYPKRETYCNCLGAASVKILTSQRNSFFQS